MNPFRIRQSCVCCAAALTLFLAACAEETPGVIEPRPDTTTLVRTGPGLYRYHCAACHGLDGRPIGAGITDLRRYGGSFGTFDTALSVGPGLMPRFPQLHDAERRMIHDHVRAFQ